MQKKPISNKTRRQYEKNPLYLKHFKDKDVEAIDPDLPSVDVTLYKIRYAHDHWIVMLTATKQDIVKTLLRSKNLPHCRLDYIPKLKTYQFHKTIADDLRLADIINIASNKKDALLNMHNQDEYLQGLARICLKHNVTVKEHSL